MIKNFIYNGEIMQKQGELTKGTLAFLNDIAYIMGYPINDTRKGFPSDVVSIRESIITILMMQDMQNSLKEFIISETVWKISKYPELNYEFIDKILAMGGIRSQAEGKIELNQILNKLKNKKTSQVIEQHDAGAQYKLGWMYDSRTDDSGCDVSKDDVQAAQWYRKAAEQGHADAQCSLGLMYEEGRGVPKDYTQAVQWYRKAADQGFAWGQYFLGVMYADGLGVHKDDAQAVALYRKAAEQGLSNAQYDLGLMYENGYGVPKDCAQAVQLYRKASVHGHTEAPNKLYNMKINSEKIIIQCEKCMKKLRVPYGKLINVTCPYCNIVFVYDGR